MNIKRCKVISIVSMIILTLSFNFIGCKGESNVVSNQEPVGTNVPSAPLNFKVNSNFYCPLLTWQVPIDSGLSKITKYNIYRGTSGNINLIGNVSSNNTQLPDLTGSENTNYIYFITASNSYGESPRSIQDTNNYKSISGNWTFTFDGTYSNPPPTIFEISSTGNFNKSISLWIGTYGGSEHYGMEPIIGKVELNGKVTGSISTSGHFSCGTFDYFNTNNYTVSGSFWHYVTLGNNYYYTENGVWSATKVHK